MVPPSADLPGADARDLGRRPRSERAVLTAVAFLAAVAVLATAMGAGWALTRAHAPGLAGPSAPRSSLRLVPQSGVAVASTGDSATAAARVTPAIVDINVTLASAGGSASAAGTGMVLTPGGEVLTNNHVVKGSTTIEVNLAGHSDRHPARVLGVDPAADVAVIQVAGVSGWPTVALADSSTLSVGERVVAIGNALGRGGAPSITAGTITGLGRSITASDGTGSSENLSGLIETDASISPGDSGGALANSAGQVIGMITAGETQGFRHRSTSVAGYAVPVSTAAAIVERIDSGHPGSDIVVAQPGYLGVAVTAIDGTTASRLGVRSGALVAGVVGGSPADHAGITRGSVITAVDGQAVDSPEALGPAIQAHRPNERITVTWVDGAGSHRSTVALGTGPPV